MKAIHVRILSALALLLPLVSVTNASAEANYEGEFVTRCLPTATCSFEVAATGRDQYRVDWLATDRTGREVYCRVSADLAVGPFEMREGEAFEEAIHGLLPDGSRVVVVDMDETAFMWTDGTTCDTRVTGGVLGLNGMYDRFIGDE